VEKFCTQQICYHVLYTMVFYVFFIVSISLAPSPFGYTPGAPITDFRQITCTVIMFAFIGIIFVQNVRRLFISQSKLAYFTSAFNFFDISAVIIVPVLTFLLTRFDWTYRVRHYYLSQRVVCFSC
jgi:hypothetical protein